MFRNTFQSGFLSILYSVGNEPLQLWTLHEAEKNNIKSIEDKDSSNNSNIKDRLENKDSDNKLEEEGEENEEKEKKPLNEIISRIEIVQDEMISSNVIELISNHLSTTYITCPPLGLSTQRSSPPTLGIKLPYVVFIVKNMDRYVSFEIQVIDDKKQIRRFRASNYQLATRVKPKITTMPLRLEPGWNQMTFDLADLVKRAYATNYIETSRVTVHANCRLRRIYFTDRLYSEDELPAEFKLFLPVDKNT